MVGEEVPAATEGLTPGESPEQTGPLPAGDDPATLVRSTAVMSVGTALSRLTGFLRVSAAAFALGVAETRMADAYNIPNNVPNMIYELILGGILTSVFVPVFVEQLLAQDERGRWHAANAIMTVTVVVLGAVMVIGILAAPWIVRLYTLRIPEADRASVQELATLFLRFFMPQILLYGLGAVASGLLNAHRRFAVPMFAPILNNLVVIAALLTFSLMPGPAEPSPGTIGFAQKMVLAVGTTLGVAVMALALWPSLRSIGFRWRWVFDLRHPAVRKLVRLSGWVAGYVALNQIGLLVAVILAGEVQGGWSAYSNAFIFFQLPHAIFAVSIMTALLPGLSERWVSGDRQGFRRTLARGLRASAFIVIPAAAGYLALARPIVRLLLEHGVAGAASTELLSGVLTLFAMGLFSFSAFALFLRAFYAMQDTRTPMLINVVAVGFNVVMNVVLFRALDVRGLALAHALAYTLAAIVAGAVLRRRLGGLEGRAVAGTLGKVLVGAAATGGAAWGAARLAGELVDTAGLGGQLVQVGAGVLAGLIIFIGAALFLRMEEFELVRRNLRGRLRR